MTQLSAEAYAIVEGRHADPFHYLGLHTEGDRTVVRAFFPKRPGSKRSASTAKQPSLRGFTMPGLFAGALPQRLQSAYQLRARFGDIVVELDDPYRFPPILTDFDLYICSAKAPTSGSTTSSAHTDDARRRRRSRLRGIRANAQRVSVVGDFTTGIRAGIRCGCAESAIGSCSCHHANSRGSLQVRYHRSAGQQTAAEVRSDWRFTRNAPEHGFHRVRRDKTAASASGARALNALASPMSIYEVHLGSWRRKGSDEWLDLPRTRRATARYVRDLGFTHIEFLPVSEHPFDGSLGLISRPACTPPDKPVSARLRTFRRWSTPATGEGLGVLPGLGCPDISLTTPRSRQFRRHRAVRARQPRCRAATSTGAR